MKNIVLSLSVILTPLVHADEPVTASGLLATSETYIAANEAAFKETRRLLGLMCAKAGVDPTICHLAAESLYELGGARVELNTIHENLLNGDK